MSLIDTYSARSNIYYILSILYKYPTESIRGHVIELQPYLKKSLQELEIDDQIQSWDLFNVKTDLVKLQIEYTRLFLGSPPNKAIVSPYESYWKQKTIMGSPVEEIGKILSESGLELAQDYADLPDHITVVLDYLHLITKNIVTYLEQGESEKAHRMIELKEKFVTNHLSWIIDFSQKLEHETKKVHYKNLAALTRSFITTEL